MMNLFKILYTLSPIALIIALCSLFLSLITYPLYYLIIGKSLYDLWYDISKIMLDLLIKKNQ